MPIKNSPKNVIGTYKKSQQTRKFIIGGLAVLLVIVGIIIVIISLTSANGPLSNLFATATPTATNTPTVTPVTPTATPTLTATVDLTPSATATLSLTGPFQYKVEAGDTCWDLANVKFKDMGFTLDALLAINNFPTGTCPINPGDIIIIPPAGAQAPTPTPIALDALKSGQVIEYTVQSGDTLQSIAIKLWSTVDRIKELNKITDTNTINAGDVIKVPVKIATPVPTLAPTSTSATNLPFLPSSTPKVTKTP